jgi:formylmethanofuran dehydrogenase subunit E
MKQEQLETMVQLAERGKMLGELWDRILEASFIIHGHICGGMPLGFRAGFNALQALGVKREADMAKLIFVETGTGHAAGCFADGVQMSTGCTFGKGLIQRAEYAKWALNLVEKGTRRAVRVSVRPEVIKAAFESPFVRMRQDGVPPTKIPLDISRSLVERLFGRSDEDLFTASKVFEYPLAKAPASCFELINCADCGEGVAANKARVKEGKIYCLPCSGYAPR